MQNRLLPLCLANLLVLVLGAESAQGAQLTTVDRDAHGSLLAQGRLRPQRIAIPRQ
jgi:hypothetical protein